MAVAAATEAPLAPDYSLEEIVSPIIATEKRMWKLAQSFPPCVWIVTSP